ncbi:hypothetical protein APHAL10511_001710 [Amanita phalloides]|nr:hypothetical protein APHAL10511_001710 [Amanita phalloides]
MQSGEIHGCRWAWCRRSFASTSALADHVFADHLTTSQPVRRSDLPMLRRIEEGYSKNFDLLSKARFELIKLPAQPLPSPPASTSPSSSPIPLTPAKNDPSFASLSSPAESHLYSPCIPDSPDLSRMISDAVRARNVLNNMGESPSKSSSSSRESVEQQLTQSMNIESQASSLHVPQTPVTPFNPGRKQTWYQTRPKTKRIEKQPQQFPYQTQASYDSQL